ESPLLLAASLHPGNFYKPSCFIKGAYYELKKKIIKASLSRDLTTQQNKINLLPRYQVITFYEKRKVAQIIETGSGHAGKSYQNARRKRLLSGHYSANRQRQWAPQTRQARAPRRPPRQLCDEEDEREQRRS